jgi:hypothetical protein
MRRNGVILVTVIFILTILTSGITNAQIVQVGDHAPALAYSTLSKTYWSVYLTYGMPFLWDKRINPWGSSHDGWGMMYSYGDDEHANPALACDTVNDRFLAVWTGEWPYYDLYGQVLGIDSNPFLISNATGAQANSTVTYDNNNERYLVTWVDHRISDQPALYGQLVNSDGTFQGTEFVIDSEFGNVDGAPFYAVAYDHVNQRFLVLSGWLYGYLINANGLMEKDKFPIFEVHDYIPIGGVAVAYDGLNQRYLFVYDVRQGVSSTTGQLLNGDGTLYGTNFWVGSPNPAVAFDRVNQRFLVAGMRRGSTNGQFVSDDGTLQGEEFVISESGYAAYDDHPAIAFNPQCGNFLVASVGGRNHSKIHGTYVRQSNVNFTVVGDPCPKATLTVKKKGYGGKTRLIQIGGVECKKNSCKEKYIAGSEVAISAYVDGVKAVFDSWTGCDTVTDSICYVTMDADKKVTANFARTPNGSR